jgi:hypothetical protein
VARFRVVLRIDNMAAGNSTRAWMPEMVEELEKRWSRTLSWEKYSSLCDRMTEIRTQLRRERGVKGPRMFCRHCNEIHEMNLGPVTIRSVLFVLKKRGLLTEAELNAMDVEWRRYRSKHGLDGCGRKRAGPSAGATGHSPLDFC